MPTLITNRLRLRPFIPSDSVPLKRIIADPTTMRCWPAPGDGELVDAWIARSTLACSQSGHGHLAVTLRGDERVIGDCGILIEPLDGVAQAVLGWTIQAPHWELGYALEAAAAVLDAAFGAGGLERIHAVFSWDHAAGQKVAERLGMTRIYEFADHANNQERTYVYMIARASHRPG